MSATVASQPDAGHTERPNHRGFTALIAVTTVLVVVLFTATTSLTLALWLTDPAYEVTNPVLDLAFFALGTVLVGGGLVTQIRAPERHFAGLQQAFLGLLALSVAGLLGDRVEPLWGGVVLLVVIAVAARLHPSRNGLMRPGAGVSARIAGLALVAIAPALAYAAVMLDLARSAGPSCFAGQCARGDRFAETAALAVAITTVALLASARTRGWRPAAWSAGLAAVVLGSASVGLPDAPGSIGTVWGGLAVGWGLLVVAAAEWETRRDAPVIPPLGGER